MLCKICLEHLKMRDLCVILPFPFAPVDNAETPIIWTRHAVPPLVAGRESFRQTQNMTSGPTLRRQPRPSSSRSQQPSLLQPPPDVRRSLLHRIELGIPRHGRRVVPVPPD